MDRISYIKKSHNFVAGTLLSSIQSSIGGLQGLKAELVSRSIVGERTGSRLPVLPNLPVCLSDWHGCSLEWEVLVAELSGLTPIIIYITKYVQVRYRQLQGDWPQRPAVRSTRHIGCGRISLILDQKRNSKQQTAFG